MTVKVIQNGQEVTQVAPGSQIRLYVSGILWPHVGFSIIDSNRNTVFTQYQR